MVICSHYHDGDVYLSNVQGLRITGYQPADVFNGGEAE